MRLRLQGRSYCRLEPPQLSYASEITGSVLLSGASSSSLLPRNNPQFLRQARRCMGVTNMSHSRGTTLYGCYKYVTLARPDAVWVLQICHARCFCWYCRWLNLFADAVHNFTDGMAIGTSFVSGGPVAGVFQQRP
jgi:zinc transporter ZupT